MAAATLRERIAALPWREVAAALDIRGYAVAGPLLGAAECAALIRLFPDDARFRSRVVMEHHHFGEGEYAYFAEPLPPLIAALRRELYRHLAPVATRWADALGRDIDYPASLPAYRRACRAAGQTKPTPLLLHYRAGGYNRLHRDRYGALHFPLQALIVLSRPGRDFEGGEFMLVENRPRQQSLGHALSPARGELVLFAGDEWPAPGRRGPLRASVRHGTSRLTAGERYSLGIIFHDAA